jgi:hypothetical protein
MNKKEVSVAQNFRKHELSKKPGGSTIKIHYKDRILVYENIHNVTKYIQAIKLKNENKKSPIILIEVHKNN